MKDVFIVNPKSGKNSQYELIQEIKEHFQGKRIIIEKTKDNPEWLSRGTSADFAAGIQSGFWRCGQFHRCPGIQRPPEA